MSAGDFSSGDLLINGAFHPSLWTRWEAAEVDCAVTARTFAADRWGVRYAAESGGEVGQKRFDEPTKTGVEIRGASSVTQDVLLGQTIEADEALRYRQTLRATAWCWMEHETRPACPVRLVISQATVRDTFDDSVETLFASEIFSVPVRQWTRLEWVFDATHATAHGLRVEWEFPATFLSHPSARVRFAEACLADADQPAPVRRPVAVETMLARRFCQRHNGRTVNAVGRALVCNPHELHFQFAFPEMRAFPAITLPRSNEELCVHSLEGIAQKGFVYDVPFFARGSAIIRATKRDHGLRDGYLSFCGHEGGILLEAEL